MSSKGSFFVSRTDPDTQSEHLNRILQTVQPMEERAEVIRQLEENPAYSQKKEGGGDEQQGEEDEPPFVSLEQDVTEGRCSMRTTRCADIQMKRR
jgi:hypothetical protein